MITLNEIIQKSIEQLKELKCECNINIEKIEFNYFNTNTEETKQVDLNAITELIYNNINKNNKTAVFGGHHYIFRDNPYTPSANAIKTFNLASKIVNYLNLNGNNANLDIIMNDVEISIKENELKSQIRKKIKENYQFPKEYNLIMNLNKINQKKINIMWEKAIFNRFEGRKNLSFYNIFPEIAQEFYPKKYNDKNIRSDMPEKMCEKAVVQYLFELYKKGIKNSILIIPNCCNYKRLNFHKPIKEALGNDFNLQIIYYTKNCYGY